MSGSRVAAAAKPRAAAIVSGEVKRPLLMAIAGISLLLCVGTLAMWTRSFFRYDTAEWGGRVDDDPPRWRVWWFQSGRGGLALTVHVTTKVPMPKYSPEEMIWKTSIKPFARFPADHVLDAGSLTDTQYPWAHDERTAWFLGFGTRGEVRPTLEAVGGRAWMDRWSRAVIIPYAAVAVATGVPPVLWLARRRREGRGARRLGHCPACGYDLRATPWGCPECGKALGSTTKGGAEVPVNP